MANVSYRKVKNLAPFHEQIAKWLLDPVKMHWTGARILDELEDRG